MDMTKVKVGSLIHVRKYRGEQEEVKGRVLSIRDTHANPIEKETHRDRVMVRSQFLILVERDNPPEGERKCKSYYHAFLEGDCVS